MRRIYLTLLFIALTLCVSADSWTTHFAYNDVNKIAAGGGKVYAVSSGALYSVDAQTEKIQTYSHQDGMNGHDVACISWVDDIESLLIMYSNGKMDILNNGQLHYIPDLYEKYTTLNKYCHSVNIRDSLAYMAMEYGIQTFNIHKREFVDTYLIGAEASEVSVRSIAFANNSIYAASDSALYVASMNDNIVDYAFWSMVTLPYNGAIQSIEEAGGVLYMLMDNICYRLQGSEWQQFSSAKYKALSVIDDAILPSDYPTLLYNDDLWMAAGDKGVLRQMATGEQAVYHIEGPLNNIPYRLTYQQGQLFMLAGGRWATQNRTPGGVSRYIGTQWHKISEADIVQSVGALCQDLMNVAVDPNDATHYFVTSYGTGLYEFRNDKCIKRWNPSNSIIGSAAEKTDRYTRTDGAIYDAQGNLWVMNAGNVPYNIVIFAANGQQVGMNVRGKDGSRVTIHTVGQLIFDNRNPNHVWALSNRSEVFAGLALIDTKGTVTDTIDDHSLIRDQWVDEEGKFINRTAIYSMRQDATGNIWLATGNGILIIPATIDYFESDLCRRLQITDDNGLPLFEDEVVNDIVFDELNRPWIASQNSGVYVLSADAKEVVAHYSMDNSALPSNTIMSLAYDVIHKRMYIGSSLGLVSYSEYLSDLNPSESNSEEVVDQGAALQWSTHFAYTKIDDIKVSATHAYALSEGSLCSINKDDESIAYYSKLTGLSGTSIQRIDYDRNTRRLVIIYDDGMIDLLDENESVHMIADLYLKQASVSKQIQDIAFHEGRAYMAMPFGIIAMNLRKEEISDTYYIGPNGSAISISAVAIWRDSIFASSGNKLYSAPLNANLVDYSQWSARTMSAPITHILAYNNDLYMIIDGYVYRNYSKINTKTTFTSLVDNHDALLAFNASKNVYEVVGSKITHQPLPSSYKPYCAFKDGSTYWLGTDEGVIRLFADESVQKYQPEGPSCNKPYFLTTVGKKLWSVPGGRWAVQNRQQGQVMYFNGSNWDNLINKEICKRLGYTTTLQDFGHVAIDPADTEHFYVACFGHGLLEFLPDGKAKQYTYNNSPLASASPDKNPQNYCRVDAITFDAERNLWLTNTSDLATNIHVIDPQNKWHSFNLYQNGQRIVLNTVSKFLVDNRDPNIKWVASARLDAGVAVFNDKGTPYVSSDDRVVFRTTFVDQDNKSITLDRLNTIVQDHNGDMWLGTGQGILVIDNTTDIFRSNACRRMKISRHDGTNLADYLLGTEQINAIVFAGGNRIWIGTEASGAYLVHMVTKENIYEPEIIEHFTSLNSPMPSDCVLSIAIDEKGEVYIGTSKGLVSYRGDATEPEETFEKAYVYPNPVRPNFEGTITISGLMDETTIYIADAAGNVVCRTHSNGGTAIWDGKTQSGKKAHSGVYTIYCNTADGKNHTVLKLLLMH